MEPILSALIAKEKNQSRGKIASVQSEKYSLSVLVNNDLDFLTHPLYIRKHYYKIIKTAKLNWVLEKKNHRLT